MKPNLEKLWQKLTVTQRAVLLVMSEALVHGADASVSAFEPAVVQNSVHMLVELEKTPPPDSTLLRPESQEFLEILLRTNEIDNFADLYESLMLRLAR